MKEDAYEEEMGLVDLQDYIEAENRRLDAENGFWAKEIVIKIEYKYWCERDSTSVAAGKTPGGARPAHLRFVSADRRSSRRCSPNLTIIDTPGLINAVPGRKNTNIQAAVRTRSCPSPASLTRDAPCSSAESSRAAALARYPPSRQSRAVEALVRSKMERRDFIILCLEDTSDWNNATTRRLVLQVDPELRRSVLVSTKFDTRIPQFSRAADVELFIKPSRATIEATPLGGGPFFTSVPSGRVGNSRESLYRSNDQYREVRVRCAHPSLAALSPSTAIKSQTPFGACLLHQPRRTPA